MVRVVRIIRLGHGYSGLAIKGLIVIRIITAFRLLKLLGLIGRR